MPADSEPTKLAARLRRHRLPVAVVAAVAVVVGIIAIVVATSSGDDAATTTGTTAGLSTNVDRSVTGSETATTVGSTSPEATITTSPTTAAVASTVAAITISPTATTTGPPASADTTAPRAPTTLGPTPPTSAITLGSAEAFSVLGNTSVSSTGATSIAGQVGAANGQVTGLSAAGNPVGVIVVDSQSARQAQLAVDQVSDALDGRAATAAIPTVLPQTVLPGTYRAARLEISGTVTLDAGGDPNAIFVFESDGPLAFDPGSRIVLAGDTVICGVYWRAGSSVTLGAGSAMVGSVIADDSIVAAGGSSVVGRLIARNGAVALDTASIAVPACA